MTEISIRHLDNAVGWRLSNYKGYSGSFSDCNRSLPAVAKEALDLVVKHWPCDFYFSTRTASEIAAAPPAEAAELLQQSVPNASIYLLAPEGKPGDYSEMWCSAWRNPFGGLSSGAKQGRFRVLPGRTDTLIAAIEDWFRAEDWRSFEPPHHREGQLGHPAVHRPSFTRELLVRCGWRIRDLCPEAFLPAQQRPAAKRTPNNEAETAVQIQAGAGRYLESMS